MSASTTADDQHDPVLELSAWALVLIVFPLIWVGGLVTTYDAGMAVPDWPGTYGRNLFLYPWTTWVAGPWNLFIEHGHRLLASLAGFVSLCLLAMTYVRHASAKVRSLAWLVVGLVVFQGVLGGLRVLLDARTLALVHGCVGPCFFLCTVLFAEATGERRVAVQIVPQSRLSRSALLGLVLTLGQLVLGAFLRHPVDDASPHMVRVILMGHIGLGLAVGGHILALGSMAIRQGWSSVVWWPAVRLQLLVVVQVLLGFAAFIVKYGWPAWLGGEMVASDFTVAAKSLWSSMIVTGHVANGSLVLAHLLVVFLRSGGWVDWNWKPSSTTSRLALGVAA